MFLKVAILQDARSQASHVAVQQITMNKNLF